VEIIAGIHPIGCKQKFVAIKSAQQLKLLGSWNNNYYYSTR
jgi:hypothetical protein